MEWRCEGARAAARVVAALPASLMVAQTVFVCSAAHSASTPSTPSRLRVMSSCPHRDSKVYERREESRAPSRAEQAGKHQGLSPGQVDTSLAVRLALSHAARQAAARPVSPARQRSHRAQGW